MAKTYKQFVADNTPAPVEVPWDRFVEYVVSLGHSSEEENGMFKVCLGPSAWFCVRCADSVFIAYKGGIARDHMRVRYVSEFHILEWDWRFQGVNPLMRQVADHFAPEFLVRCPERVISGRVPWKKEGSQDWCSEPRLRFQTEERALLEEFCRKYKKELGPEDPEYDEDSCRFGHVTMSPGWRWNCPGCDAHTSPLIRKN